MRQPKPLPTAPPFLTFLTPTYKRPVGLARNMESVAKQTAVEHIEQIVFPDHVGYGVPGGLFGRMPWFALAARGKYVNVFGDDDVLAGETVVAQVMAFAKRHQDPEVIVVDANKGGLDYPAYQWGAPPEAGLVDLCNHIVRRDVWLANVQHYGLRYEGDFDFALALFDAGYRHERLKLMFAIGANSGGRAEVEWR